MRRKMLSSQQQIDAASRNQEGRNFNGLISWSSSSHRHNNGNTSHISCTIATPGRELQPSSSSSRQLQTFFFWRTTNLLLENYERSSFSSGKLRTFFWNYKPSSPFSGTTNLLQIYVFVLAVTLVGLLQVGCTPSGSISDQIESTNTLQQRLVGSSAQRSRRGGAAGEAARARSSSSCSQSGGKRVADDQPKPSSPLAKLSRIDSIAAGHVWTQPPHVHLLRLAADWLGVTVSDVQLQDESLLRWLPRFWNVNV